MKFMKLGSKSDVFQADGNIRYVATEMSSDIIINVEDSKFYLHKFPLLCKSRCLQSLVAKAAEAQNDEVDLPDFPGGAHAFELCAKFCYGIVVTLNAYNVVAVRCAAEYLGMTEAMEKGNLIYKIEVFFSSSLFRTTNTKLHHRRQRESHYCPCLLPVRLQEPLAGLGNKILCTINCKTIVHYSTQVLKKGRKIN